MSELTKQQLAVENNTSFPNNNTGFITPTLLRTFNGNIIDSLVDEVTYNADSASWTSDIDGLQAFSSSLVTNFVTATQLSASSSTLQNNINTKLSTASFNTYTASQSPSATGSLLTTASAVGNVITFTKGDSSTFPVTIATGSVINTGSFVTTSSFNSYTASASTNVSASINAATSSLSSSLTLTDNSKLNTASFNTYTASASTNVSGAINAATSSLSSSLTLTDNSKLNTASFNTYTASAATNVSASINAATSSLSASLTTTINGISSKTGSYITSAQTASMTVLSASFAQTASFLLGTVASASFATSASFAQTASIANNLVVRATNDNASTLVRGTVVRITGANGDNPLFNSASWDNDSTSANALGILQSDVTSGTTGSIVVTGVVVGVNTDGMTAGNILYLSSSGQFTTVQPQAPLHIVTLGEVLRVQLNNGSIFVNISNGWELDELHNVAINGVADGDLLVYRSATSLWTNSSSAELGLVTTSSFNSYTSSEASNVSASINSATSSLSASLTLTDNSKLNSASFNSFTASVITTGSSAGTQAITGSLIVSGATFNGKIEAPSLSIGTTTLDVLFESTASTTASNVVSEIDFTRLGAGPTGDLTGIRLQTLSGSDTAGDTLLSRITTGVNRHTTTAMTGSVVNTIIQSTWATGSAGTRVSYASTITANAQSASATITLAAGNAASNYNGGTASFNAGLTRIGASGGTITTTGSLQHSGSIAINGGNPTIVSGSLSGSLVSSLGDIYPSTPQGNFIVTLTSASMATLLSGSTTNANTLYFVI